MKFSRRFFAPILFLLFSTVCFSQVSTVDKPERKNRKIKEEKSDKPIEVKVNVSVLDSSGKLVNNLQAADFRIYEDGVEQKITRFAKKEGYLNIGLVLDNTGSMRTQLDAVISAGATFVSVLRPGDAVFLLRFVSSDKLQIVREWTSDKNLLNKGLSEMFVEGGQSAVIDALYLSAGKLVEREKADKSRRSALIIITDGEDRDSFYTKQDVFRLFEGSDAQIFTIGLIGELPGKEARQNPLNKGARQNSIDFINRLSLETGGASYFVDNQKKNGFEAALLSALKAIITELGSQYIVAYTPTKQKRDGSTRKLRAEVTAAANGEKRQVFAREEFTVPKEK
jgi:Ca-activated chloride channel family protein